eukprot:scaffold11998_cov174-Amphora_coffeaeformis.AAC.13
MPKGHPRLNVLTIPFGNRTQDTRRFANSFVADGLHKLVARLASQAKVVDAKCFQGNGGFSLNKTTQGRDKTEDARSVHTFMEINKATSSIVIAWNLHPSLKVIMDRATARLSQETIRQASETKAHTAGTGMPEPSGSIPKLVGPPVRPWGDFHKMLNQKLAEGDEMVG